MTRREAAVHEAGHAVIGRAVGLDIRKVEVYEDGSGKCWTTSIERNSREDVKNELAYVLAGRIAVALEADEPLWRLSLRDILDRERNPTWPGSATRGYEGFRRSVAELYGSESAADRWLEAQLPVIAKKTYGVLVSRWAEVADLATRLMEQGTVHLAENGSSSVSGRASGAPREFALARTLAERLKRNKRTRPTQAEVDECVRFLADESSSAADRSYVSATLTQWKRSYA